MRAMRRHFLCRVNMSKLFCLFRIGLKSAFYATSKFVLTMYFCEALLFQVNRSMRNIKQQHLFDIL